MENMKKIINNTIYVINHLILKKLFDQ